MSMNFCVQKSLLESREATKHKKFSLGENTGYNWTRRSQRVISFHLVERII